MDHKLGHYAFIIGVIIAIVAGIFERAIKPETATLILVVLGIIVGFMNVSAKETTSFLVAAIALLIAGTANVDIISVAGLGGILSAILSNIAVFVAPAAIVVAVRTVFALAEE